MDLNKHLRATEILNFEFLETNAKKFGFDRYAIYIS